jgi:transcriptional regulator GlxA family with amidase domain
VANAASAREVAALLDRYLMHALRDMPAGKHPVDGLMQEIQATRGALSILSWARAHGLDARHLERSFSASVGMTPKRYARIIRFKHSYHELLGSGVRPGRSHLHGYYDQAHFNKEFKTFIGTAPGTWLGSKITRGTSISDHLLAGEFSAEGAGARGALEGPRGTV